MQKQELKKKILDVIKNYPVGSVATIKDGKPWVRYMVMQPQEDLTLFTTTCMLARKVDQIKKDQNVHVVFGLDPKNWALPFVNVEGKAEILTDSGTKKKSWKEEYKQYYQGPDDPNYGVIKITPSVIECMAAGARQPEVYEI
jgi:general stress protein 26